jgi:hypothetical protein
MARFADGLVSLNQTTMGGTMRAFDCMIAITIRPKSPRLDANHAESRDCAGAKGAITLAQRELLPRAALTLMQGQATLQISGAGGRNGSRLCVRRPSFAMWSLPVGGRKTTYSRRCVACSRSPGQKRGPSRPCRHRCPCARQKRRTGAPSACCRTSGTPACRCPRGSAARTGSRIPGRGIRISASAPASVAYLLILADSAECFTAGLGTSEIPRADRETLPRIVPPAPKCCATLGEADQSDHGGES